MLDIEKVQMVTVTYWDASKADFEGFARDMTKLPVRKKKIYKNFADLSRTDKATLFYFLQVYPKTAEVCQDSVCIPMGDGTYKCNMWLDIDLTGFAHDAEDEWRKGIIKIISD